MPTSPVHPWRSRDGRLGPAAVRGADLATHTIFLQFEVDRLTFAQVAHSGALNGADVHDHILAAIVRLNEAKALLRIEPFDGTGSHDCSPRHEKLLLEQDCSND